MAKALKKQVLSLAQAGDIENLKKISLESTTHWVKCLSPTGDTPLHIAAEYGKEDVIRFLLDEWTNNQNNVDFVSASGKTALHEAAQFSRPKVVKLLLERGANPRALKQADWTPLMLACTKKGTSALECCKLLYESGGPLALKDCNKDGWIPLHMAAREGDIDILRWLLNLEPNLCATLSKNGRTPLHTAALHGHAEAVSLFLQTKSVGPNIKDSCGSTPVHDAVRIGDIDTLVNLIAQGGDIKLTNALGQGVVHMAAETGNANMLEYIFKNYGLKADPGTFTCTPLHCAIRAGKPEAVRTLLQQGADIHVKDSNGYSCMDLARNSKCQTTLGLIEDVFSSRATNTS